MFLRGEVSPQQPQHLPGQLAIREGLLRQKGLSLGSFFLLCTLVNPPSPLSRGVT